jgi:hypothetical protein
MTDENFLQNVFETARKPSELTRLLRVLAAGVMDERTFEEGFSSAPGWDKSHGVFEVTGAPLTHAFEPCLDPTLWFDTESCPNVKARNAVRVTTDERGRPWAQWQTRFQGVRAYNETVFRDAKNDATPLSLFAQAYTLPLLLSTFGYEMALTRRSANGVFPDVAFYMTRETAHCAGRPWPAAANMTANSEHIYATALDYVEAFPRLPEPETLEDAACKRLYCEALVAMERRYEAYRQARAGKGATTSTLTERALAWSAAVWSAAFGMTKALAGDIDSTNTYTDFGSSQYGLHLHDVHRDCVYLVVRPGVVPCLVLDELVVRASFRRVSAEEYARTFGLKEGDEVDESLDETFGHSHDRNPPENN